MQQDTIIIPYVKLPPRADRFYGGPEVEIEIGGKRAPARLDTGNSGQSMLLKSTADYLEIKRKFHPLAGGGKIYDVPLTLVGGEKNITVHAPVLLAEDVNPRLDNDSIPAHLFTTKYAISFYRDHAESPSMIIKKS